MRIVFESNHIPAQGRYKNVVLEDVALGKNYLYDSQGTYLILDRQGIQGVQGVPGTAGTNGTNGKDGFGVTPDGLTLNLRSPNGYYHTFTIANDGTLLVDGVPISSSGNNGGGGTTTIEEFPFGLSMGAYLVGYTQGTGNGGGGGGGTPTGGFPFGLSMGVTLLS